MQHLTDASKSISINGTEGPAVIMQFAVFQSRVIRSWLPSGEKGYWYTGKLVASNKQRIMTLQGGPIFSGRK